MKLLGNFDAVNLEDIKAPECFDIEEGMNECGKLPVFHDDQHGTAIVTLAGLINAVKVVEKDIKACKVIINGAGAAGITMSGVVALSWTGSLFFSTLENYIPNTMPRTKLVVNGVKYGIALPIRCVEWTSNQIFGFAEKMVIGRQLPTNVTEVYKLNIGPKLENITEIKKPVLSWLINQLNKWNK